MEQSLALSVGLPAVLCVIMLGLGLSLRLADFARVLSDPRPVLIGVACHVVVLPALCFGLVRLLDLPPAIAVGMMLLAASPAGTSGTLYTHLARGDVAVALTMAAVTTLLAIVTLPAIANFSLAALYGDVAGTVYLETEQVLQIIAIAIVPALIGMRIRATYPGFAERAEKIVRLLATLFLLVIVLFALISQWSVLMQWGTTIGWAVTIFNLASLGIAYVAPRLFGVGHAQAVGISMATGIHNAAIVIAIAIAEYMLNSPEMAIAPAAYGLLAYITAGIYAWFLQRFARPNGSRPA
ncbi:MAG: bile acid:sodium symporter family protein [Rhizobiaceae bacterium]